MGFELVILGCAILLFVAAGLAWLIDWADGKPEKYSHFGSQVKGEPKKSK